MGKSARKKPRLPKSNQEDAEFDPAPIIITSDDEADDDLSLKIVQKAMLRAAGNETSSNPESSSTEVKRKRKRKKAKDKEKTVAQVNDVKDVITKEDGGAATDVDVTVEADPSEKSDNVFLRKHLVEDVVTQEDGDAAIDADVTVEADPSEKSDNVVLRKLLRGPRYFDPPDNSWGNCYNCGEAGHTAAKCTSAKRIKPCFVCGSLEHMGKQCTKGKDCFICKKGGHRAKDCPEKFKLGSAKICLKCGNSGHEMFSCKSNYSPDDLKEIQCYVCKCFGHLCCLNYSGEGAKEVSCYRCGELGHSGWECARFNAETTSNGTPSSCYKCGQEGHMARKCPSSAKKEKRKSESSGVKKKKNKYGSHLGVRSAPQDLGNARKRNKTQYGQPSSSQPKPRGRGGWITEDPGDYNHNYNHNYNQNYNYNPSHNYHNHNRHQHHNNGWESPRTPAMYGTNDRFHGGSGYSSGYNGYQQQRFSASRFGNSSNYGKRDHGWDY